MDYNGQNNEVGTIAGTLIIVALLLVGGVYFFGQRIEKQKEAQALQTQSQSSSSDDINSIKNDAAALDFSHLGDGVNNL